jgi:hypothetical protein
MAQAHHFTNTQPTAMQIAPGKTILTNNPVLSLERARLALLQELQDLREQGEQRALNITAMDTMMAAQRRCGLLLYYYAVSEDPTVLLWTPRNQFERHNALQLPAELQV